MLVGLAITALPLALVAAMWLLVLRRRRVARTARPAERARPQTLDGVRLADPMTMQHEGERPVIEISIEAE
ncbi:MAG: hypothetical protein H6737_16270 [Alphaproteobacteria bacterium]|nr:hypothetical protein [Alphaproteobacteria bacterium]